MPPKMPGSECVHCVSGDSLEKLVINDNWPKNIALSKCGVCNASYLLVFSDPELTSGKFNKVACYSVKECFEGAENEIHC